MSGSDELRDAVEDLANQPLESDLTVSELKEEYDQQYGRNAIRRMAEDAGMVGPGRLPAKGTDERKTYDAFRRRLERYIRSEQGLGGETRRARPGFINDLARRVGSSRAPGSITGALRRIRADGVNVVHIRVKVKGSGDRRYRVRAPSFFVYLNPDAEEGPELLQFVDQALDDDWAGAADHFVKAWAIAYGITNEVDWEDLEGLTLAW